MAAPWYVHDPVRLLAVHIPILLPVPKRKYLPSALLTTDGSWAQHAPVQAIGSGYAVAAGTATARVVRSAVRPRRTRPRNMVRACCCCVYRYGVLLSIAVRSVGRTRTFHA